MPLKTLRIRNEPATSNGSRSGSSSAVASCICASALPVSVSDAGSGTPWRSEISVISCRIGPELDVRQRRAAVLRHQLADLRLERVDVEVGAVDRAGEHQRDVGEERHVLLPERHQQQHQLLAHLGADLADHAEVEEVRALPPATTSGSRGAGRRGRTRPPGSACRSDSSSWRAASLRRRPSGASRSGRPGSPPSRAAATSRNRRYTSGTREARVRRDDLRHPPMLAAS